MRLTGLSRILACTRMSLGTLLAKKKMALEKKLALASENVDIRSCFSPASLNPQILTEPFPHIVVDDFLKPEAYEAIENDFRKRLAIGVENTPHRYDRFHTFDIDYDGYKYAPEGWTDPAGPLYFFYSAAWNTFFSQLFNQPVTLTTSMAYHHHPPGDRTGFVHHDFADRYFDIRLRLQSGVIPRDMMPNIRFQNQKENILIERRAIAILFYVANPPWKEGDGGETGLYADDQKTLLKKIPPVNNRLLAFHISKRSYHAFQANTLPRNCIVQWFHIPEALI